MQVVRDIKTAVDGQPGVIGVTGVGALQLDYQNGVYGTFPLVLALLVVVTYILLVRAFRSLLVPLKAIILNLVSLAATFGGVVLFWQYGWGSKSVFGVAPTGSITFWLPIMIFAFLFGLSMDYEVFILSRIREEYDRTGSTNRAVIEGVGRTGRLVTSAALILFLAFLRSRRGRRRTSRFSPPAWASASCSTPPSCACCWCRRWCRCSGSGTGTCRRRSRGFSGSRSPTTRLRRPRPPRWKHPAYDGGRPPRVRPADRSIEAARRGHLSNVSVETSRSNSAVMSPVS